MAQFNNQQNNQRDVKDIYTKSYEFRNKNGFMPSMVIFKFWNEMLSIKIHPALDADKQSETKLYDYEKWVSTALTVDKVKVLIQRMEEKIFPAIKNNEEASIAVDVGGDSLVYIGTGKKTTGSIRPQLGIFKGISPETKTTENYILYEFKQTRIIDDYDIATGSFETNETIAELGILYDLFKAYVSAGANAHAHSMKVSDRYFRDTTTAIASKLGVETNSGFKKNNNKTNVFGGGSSSQQSYGSSTPIIVETEVDDLDNYM